jgi:hypothetical protein
MSAKKLTAATLYFRHQQRRIFITAGCHDGKNSTDMTLEISRGCRCRCALRWQQGTPTGWMWVGGHFFIIKLTSGSTIAPWHHQWQHLRPLAGTQIWCPIRKPTWRSSTSGPPLRRIENSGHKSLLLAVRTSVTKTLTEAEKLMSRRHSRKKRKRKEASITHWERQHAKELWRVIDCDQHQHNLCYD